MSEIYNEFARYYDCFMSHIDYETEAGEIFRLLFETGNTQNPVLDCGCGSGGHLLPLLELEANVDGIDFSEEMVELLKAKTANFRERCGIYHGDMRSFKTQEGSKKYALIYSLGETVHHLKGYEDIAKFLAASRHNLKEGGLLVFSWKEPGYFEELMDYGDFYEEHDDNYLLWHIEEGTDREHYNLCYTAFVKNNLNNQSSGNGEDAYRRIREVHSTFILEEAPLKKLIKTRGFTLRDDYAELSFATSLKEEYKRIMVLQK